MGYVSTGGFEACFFSPTTLSISRNIPAITMDICSEEVKLNNFNVPFFILLTNKLI